MTLTDICFVVTLVAVAIGFGGRMASGQFALVVGASATAFVWLLYQLTSREPRYFWTGSEWLWGLGILVGVSQIIPLPREILLKISPQLKEILPLWFDKPVTEMSLPEWSQLSLAPWETASGLATFVSYAMMFLVASQRLRTIADVERSLCGVSIAAVVMMLFAQIQFATSNGKFFWVYEHPYMNTDSYPLGCFTNRNHLAQFLVLAVAPLIWWLLSRIKQQEQDHIQRRSLPASMHYFAVILLIVSLGGIVLTVLMTISRGGLLALALATVISFGLMCRIGLASTKFGAAMLLVGVVTASLFSYSRYESLMTSRLEQNSGRSDIWKANIEVAKDFPLFGTGIGTHADAYRLHFQAPEELSLQYSHAESGYLQVASESGIAGLIVAVLMILTSFFWCVRSLGNKDARVSSAAAAIIASLTANVVHAVGDFFWYTPACMLLLAVQLACASRLRRLTASELKLPMYSFSLPRFATCLAICAWLPLAGWMVSLKQPAFLAEPHHIESVLLSKVDERDVSEDEKAATNQRRLKEAVLAAKLDPRNASFQEKAALAYVELFEFKQKNSETGMSANMIRDALKASNFQSVADANQWLDRAIGPNLKLLRIAAKSVRRSLSICPLRANSYVLLTELEFLDRMPDEDFQKNCLAQALKLRPTDAETLYLVGKSGLLEGDLEKALRYWRPAFEQNAQTRERIAELLVAGQFSPESFEKEFHLDLKSLDVLAKAYTKADNLTDALQIWREYIRKGMSQARKLKKEDELESTLIGVRNACREIRDIAAATETSLYGVKRLPQSYSIRYMLSIDLIDSQRMGEAAEHLKWCAAQNPNDEGLQKLASQAVTERLRQPPTTALRDENVEQTGLRK